MYIDTNSAYIIFDSIEEFEAYKQEKLAELDLVFFSDIVLVPHALKDSVSITVIYNDKETICYLEPNTAYGKERLYKIVYGLTSISKSVDYWKIEMGDTFNPAEPLTSSVRIIPVVKVTITFEDESETYASKEILENHTLVRAFRDTIVAPEISTSQPITFTPQAIRLKGTCVIKLFYYNDRAEPVTPKLYSTTFGEQLSYALNQSEVKALTPSTILHNESNIIYQFDFWVDATTHVPLGAGNIDEVDKTKLVYGVGDIIQIGALYNE
ncbi:MAG TPA: hypothetical protein GX708_20955 [Gallicola sp.]|nr:hypothetical protein [Gallicola sp.]